MKKKYLSQIEFTPISNIVNNLIHDPNLISRRRFDSDNDVFKVTNECTRDRMDTLMNISLYNDIVTIDGVECKILSMLTKSADLWHEDNQKCCAIN